MEEKEVLYWRSKRPLLIGGVVYDTQWSLVRWVDLRPNSGTGSYSALQSFDALLWP